MDPFHCNQGSLKIDGFLAGFFSAQGPVHDFFIFLVHYDDFFFLLVFDPVGEYIYILYNDMFRYVLNCTFPSKHGPHWLPTWALAYVGTSPEYHPG